MDIVPKTAWPRTAINFESWMPITNLIFVQRQRAKNDLQDVRRKVNLNKRKAKAARRYLQNPRLTEALSRSQPRAIKLMKMMTSPYVKMRIRRTIQVMHPMMRKIPVRENAVEVKEMQGFERLSIVTNRTPSFVQLVFEVEWGH